MNVSTLAKSIASSPTMRLNQEAAKLRTQGEPVIHLGIGEPENDAPESAILAATAKLGTRKLKYSPTSGTPSLKKAIIQYTRDNYGRDAGPENVIVSGGAKHSIFNLLYTLLNPKDEVIILAPYWVSYPEMVKMCNGKPIIVKPQDGGVHPRIEEIAAAAGSSTKAVIVNSPNNPSGAIFSDDFICDIVEYCEHKGIYLIMDDIYHKLVFDGKKAVSAYKYARKDLNSGQVIVVNGVSKLYGMTGFRIGWTVAPREIVEVMTNVQSQTTSCSSPLLEAAAEGALTGSQDVVQDLRLSMQKNRDLAMKGLKELAGVKVAKPDGTFYCLPDFSAYNSNSEDLASFLLTKAKVVTVPGKEFGMEGHLRLSYSGSAEDVTEGIARIRWALDPNSPSEIRIGEKKLVRDWV